MSRLKGTLVLVALVALGGFGAIWIRRQIAPPPILPDHRTIRPPSSTSPTMPVGDGHDHAPPAAPQANPKASLLVKLRHAGKPAPGISFLLMEEATHRRAAYTTGADGTHAILGLPAGKFHVTIDHPDYVATIAHRMVQADRGHEIVIELERGANLQGKVTDSAGRPLEGTLVHLADSQGMPMGPVFEATTNATGEYRIGRLPAGLVHVGFRRTGFRGGPKESLNVGGTGHEHRLDKVLAEGRIITGKVVTEDGTPLPGATVIGSNEETSTCRADERGVYALRELGDGPVSAFASAAGYGAVYRRNLTPGSTNIDFQMSKAAEVLGRVSAQPIPAQYTVRISRLEPEYGRFIPLYTKSYDGASGDGFRIGEIPPGRYRLEVEAQGFEAQDIPELDLTAGQSLTGIQIRLRKTS